MEYTFHVLQNKPNGQFHLPFNAKLIVEFVRDLPIRKIPGVGRVNERLLDSIGIKVSHCFLVRLIGQLVYAIQTCGDIFAHRATVYLMDKYFGANFLLSTYLGIASNVVRPYQREERKSIGSERCELSVFKGRPIEPYYFKGLLLHLTTDKGSLRNCRI